MRSRYVFLVAAMVVIAMAATYAQQGIQTPRSIRLEFPDGTDLTGLSVGYYLTGPFGGFGDGVRTRANVRTYDVEAWQAGQPAKTLKAIIYCPGRRFVLVSESGFGNGPAKLVPVRFETLGSVPLKGRVTNAGQTEVEVDVTYGASWSHRFFGIDDGPVSQYRVGSAELKADGSFALPAPDFAADPIVAGHGATERGGFHFRTRDPTTGNGSSLRGTDQASVMRVPIAASYPTELQFDLPR